MTTKKTKPAPRAKLVTLTEAHEFKRVMTVVARWLQEIPRDELTTLAVTADKETAVFEALKTFIERIMECNDAVISRIATQLLSGMINNAGPRQQRRPKPKKIIKQKRRTKK